MKENWFYLEKIGNAGLPARPPRIKDLGEHSIEIFVRELIQNSLDARLGDDIPVTINIKIEEWSKEAIDTFFSLISNDHLNKFSESYAYPNIPADVKPKMKGGYQLIKGQRKKSFGLIIEEENCIGLTGSVTGIDGKSNFNSLIRKIDDNQAKKELTNSGGTWGKGSSVFAYSSELWMWFCYTCLSTPYKEDEGIIHHKRFIGRGVLSPYYNTTSKKGYFGDCWFCKPNTDAFPFVNDEADSYAEVFGFDIRKNKKGTTFFIPFFNPFLNEPNLEDVKKEFHDQVLKNWYIPIFNGELIVTLSDNSGNKIKIDKKYLSGIEQLKFKLEILNWSSNGCPPDEKMIKETYDVEVPGLKDDYVNDKNSFAAQKQKIKLDLLIRIIDEDEIFNNEWGTCNKVALTRNRGMLIDDHIPFDLKSIKTESILFTGLLSKSEPDLNKRKHLDLFLAYSENPAHNKWCNSSRDYNSCFLDFFEGKRPAPEYYINKIFDEIYKSFKKLFDQEQQPETSKDICSIFKKIAKLRIAGGISGGPSLFSLRTPASITNPLIENSGEFIFQYIIKSNIEISNIEIDFKSIINSLEGETSSDFDVLGVPEFKNIYLLDEQNQTISFGENPKIKILPLEEKIIKVKTCKILGNRNFKNLDPRIKASAKKITNE